METVACCSFHNPKALALPNSSERTTKKPHADTYIYLTCLFPILFVNNKGKTGLGIFTYPWDIYRCFVFDELKNLRDSWIVKTKASSKRPFQYVFPTLLPPRREGIRREDGAKVHIFSEERRMKSEEFHEMCYKT